MNDDRSSGSRVTPIQRRVYELRNESHPPRPWREIGRLMGETGDTANVRRAYKRAVANMKLDATRPIEPAKSPGRHSGRKERLTQLWGTRAEQSLGGMTTDKFEKASLRDLAIMAGIGTEKILLLHGQPTEIIRTEEDRRTLTDLAAAFVLEAKRRNVEIDVSPSSGSTLSEPER